MEEYFVAGFRDELEKIATVLTPGKARRMDKTVRDFLANLVKRKQAKRTQPQITT